MEKHVQSSLLGTQRSPKGLKTSLGEEMETQTLLQMWWGDRKRNEAGDSWAWGSSSFSTE